MQYYYKVYSGQITTDPKDEPIDDIIHNIIIQEACDLHIRDIVYRGKSSVYNLYRKTYHEHLCININGTEMFFYPSYIGILTNDFDMMIMMSYIQYTSLKDLIEKYVI